MAKRETDRVDPEPLTCTQTSLKVRI